MAAMIAASHQSPTRMPLRKKAAAESRKNSDKPVALLPVPPDRRQEKEQEAQHRQRDAGDALDLHRVVAQVEPERAGGAGEKEIDRRQRMCHRQAIQANGAAQNHRQQENAVEKGNLVLRLIAAAVLRILLGHGAGGVAAWAGSIRPPILIQHGIA
jgi:hypothetical protein